MAKHKHPKYGIEVWCDTCDKIVCMNQSEWIRLVRAGKPADLGGKP